MATPSGPRGQFVPTTATWKMQQLRSRSGISGPVAGEFIELYRTLNQIAIALNNKDTGIYSIEEIVTGNKWFPLEPSGTTSAQQRSSIRKAVYIEVGLPNTGSASFPHGIMMNNSIQFVDIYGIARNPTTQSFLKLPFAHPTAANSIALEVLGDNVVITTGINRSTYTQTYVVLEYLTE